jgi:hypothetical protein
MRKNKWWTGWTLGHADGPHLPGELSARCGQSSLSPITRSQPLLSISGSPKRFELLRKYLGEMWSVPRGSYAPKLEPSNELNRRESNHNRALPKSKGSNRNPSLGGRIQRLRGHDESQRCTRKLSMTPTNKSELKHLRIEGTRRAWKSNKKSLKKTWKSHELQEGDRHNHESFYTLGGLILYKWVKNLNLWIKEKRSSPEGWFVWKS